MMHRRTLLVASAATLAAPALAQSWRPDRPIEIVVGFTPGGATDVDARLFVRFLEPRIGGTCVVVNRPGAGGEVALAAIARGRADGTLIGTTNMPGLLTIPIERPAQFKLDDFTPIGNIVGDPSAISVRADSPYQTIEQLFEAARREPEGISFGSPGIGTDDHLLVVLLQQATGLRFNHVAFQGDPPIRTAILGRQLIASGLNLGYVLTNMDGMRLLALAANERSRFAPDLPTLKEKGIDVTMASERGLVMPVATPAHIVSRFREATDDIAKDPEFIRAIEARSLLVRHESGEAWFTRLRADEQRYRALWQTTPWAQR
ncbi:tripartite tricarboxylate transporter substrate binding protein [Sediminicoccus sp. KRV36]|uniref:tripartite tricarboxylate transporter substrate binding protein n=1 Tax=Sediminicoccus sp. KRV36 TaxID=3133721 RepID=UPI00200CFD7C|nr:tripartite tricarboxylate transporter substrate binding protein [Sediminicoccus rosea]UPY37953.1 tripartite tricarboxylate transporter substrate binding protein [Sediminicoccus rosea]